MKYFVIYQITNIINNKIYIGKHQTSDVNDGYMGSGKLLRQAQAKCGINNFIKEILFVFGNEDEMNSKEKELVTEEFCLREDTYNLCSGGHGGFSYINRNNLTDYKKAGSSGGTKTMALHKETIVERLNSENVKQKSIKTRKENQLGVFNPEVQLLAKERLMSHETLEKRKNTFRKINHQAGDKNSQYGTIWVYHLENKISKKIKKDLLTEYLDLGWLKGRKIFASVAQQDRAISS